MAEATVYSETGAWKLKDLGVQSFSKEGGAVTGKLFKAKKSNESYLVMATENVTPGEYQLGNMTLHIVPGEKIENTITPSYDMTGIYNNPVTGIAVTGAASAPALYASLTGLNMIPYAFLGGAATLGLGFIGLIPNIIKGTYDQADRLWSYAKGKSNTFTKGQDALLSKGPGIIEELEKLIYDTKTEE